MGFWHIVSFICAIITSVTSICFGLLIIYSNRKYASFAADYHAILTGAIIAVVSVITTGSLVYNLLMGIAYASS